MNPARILVVDDDEAIRLLVTRLFRREGHDVSSAGDGEEAIEMLDTRHYDLVILDVMMPRKDGIAVAERIAASPEPRPKVIIMTAAVPSIVDRLPKTGVWTVISKPFNLEQILQEARAALAS
jgi:CheY-like chemotaxis protein